MTQETIPAPDDRSAPLDRPIHPLLAARWSPRAFDGRPVPACDLLSLFEAARWTPSRNNDQPWHFIHAPAGSDAFGTFLATMTERNRSWARHAPLLVVAAVRLNRLNDGTPNPHALYDLGQSVAYLTVEAMARGIFVHQLSGFDADAAANTLGLPDGHRAVTILAVGYRGTPDHLPGDYPEKEQAPRERRPVTSFVHAGRWGGKDGA